MTESAEIIPMDNPEVAKANALKHAKKEGYPISDESPYISRCIDGRYTSEDRLPALAIPGADIGQIVQLLAAGNDVPEVEIDLESAMQALIEVVGGVKNIRIHTDNHKVDEGIAAGCGYFAKVKEDPTAFGVTKEQVDAIGRKFEQLISEGAEEIVLIGDHQEKGVLIVNGQKSIKPDNKYFVFHETLVFERNRQIVERLFPDDENKRLALLKRLEGTPSEPGVVYEHLSLIKGKLAPNAPVFKARYRAGDNVVVTPQP